MFVPDTGRRLALVTGGNRGIGLEVCRQLAAQGYAVLLGARDDAQGRAAAAKIPGAVTPVRCDVTSETSIAALAHHPVDVLVNNAGIHYDTWQTAVDADLDGTVAEALEVNLLGAWRLIRTFAPGMTARGWGRIVNVSSEAGSLHSMGAGPPAYQVSKAALNALTRTVAGELRGRGVLVNAVCPGWVATDMGGAGGRPVPDGAASVVWAVTLPDGGPTGGFYRDGRAIPW